MGEDSGGLSTVCRFHAQFSIYISHLIFIVRIFFKKKPNSIYSEVLKIQKSLSNLAKGQPISKTGLLGTNLYTLS